MIKNRKIHILVLVLLMMLSLSAHAQWDVPYSQFWIAKGSYNPSFAGSGTSIDVSALYKCMYAGVDDAPKVINLSASMPFEFLGLRHGVGLVFENSNVGKEQNIHFAAQYSYNQKVGRGMLNAGVQVGFRELNYDAASLMLRVDSTNGSQKQALANPVDKRRIDMSAGLSFTTARFFAGVGVRHINEPGYYSVSLHNSDEVVNNDSTLSKIPMSYNLMMGYNIKLFNTLFELEPMLFYETSTDFENLYGALQLSWNRKYSLGAMWRKDAGYSMFAGAAFSNIVVRYAYDKNKYDGAVNFGANHEVSLQYSFDLDLFRPKPQPHKSIRLL